ncbi:MAG: glycosyltransferase family 2 protein [Candidatus Eiseniibacteriota bacterium]|nr:MAG: glycosyltransferase family 2 protein [Candidatus Eisenbacteria bacterium]
MKLSVIVPVYNEARTIGEILKRIRAVDIEKEILIVDDCSTDGTREFLKSVEHEKDLRVFYHSRNMGKGSAIRTAISEVQGDAVIIQDADLEYDPNDYLKLVAPIEEGRATVVYGSRYSNPENELPFTKFKVAVLFLTALANLLYGARITDEATCYKVFRADVLKSIPLKCKRFEFCPEVTAKVRKRGHRIAEVPISFKYRTVKEGKKIGWRDGIEAIVALVRYRFVD